MTAPNQSGGRGKDQRYSSKRWQRLKQQALVRDGFRCVVAGCTASRSAGDRLVVDHIVEVRDGGPFWDLNNLQTLCRSHHFKKTNREAARREQPPPVSPNA